MLEFACYYCSSPIAVSESARGKSTICYNCNTRQPVPENAIFVPENSTERDPAPPRAPTPRGTQWGPVDAEPPIYNALHFTAGLIVILGFIECVLSVVFILALGPFSLTGVIGGVITIGFGLALFCLRNIAIDIWHIRRQ